MRWKFQRDRDAKRRARLERSERRKARAAERAARVEALELQRRTVQETQACANCLRELTQLERTDNETYCVKCVWLALRLMRDEITLIPVVGPIVAIFLDNKVIGLTAVYVNSVKTNSQREALPILTLNERAVARFLHRQGRLVQRSSS